MPSTLRHVHILGNEYNVIQDRVDSPPLFTQFPSSLETLRIVGLELNPPLPFHTTLCHLKHLDLACNKLRHIPATLPQTLQFLDVNGNHLTPLPHFLPSGLKHLNANDNHLRKLPPLGTYKKLRFLDVGKNDLQRLPSTLPLTLVSRCFRKLIKRIIASSSF